MEEFGPDDDEFAAFVGKYHSTAELQDEVLPPAWPWPRPARYAVGSQHPLIYGNTRPQTNPSATVRVFCFLWTGGCASFFQQLQRLFIDSAVELVPVNLPGRDKDAETAPTTRWPDAVAQIADALCDGWVQAMPYAMFGHSLGAWTAIEAIHTLRDRRVPLPLHLFVSAKFAPQLSADERTHALSQFRAHGGLGATADLGSVDAPKVASADADTFWAFNHMYGLDKRLSDSAFFRSSFEEIFRADLCLSEAYRGSGSAIDGLPRESASMRLRCGITAMAAAGDIMVPEHALEGEQSMCR
jgi:surfactin synthase thioesterase subunit